LTETILEAELFGYERGAFSGALNRGKTGLFEAADRGTLLLDEVGEMGPSLQAKLLRVLQDRSFIRVGGTKQLTVDVRKLASTNRDIEEAVANGTIRKYLYYRLNVVEVRIPPLRDRVADIAPLARAFLQGFSQQLGKRLVGFTRNSMQELVSYSWPGNVRELKNVIERAAILAPGPFVRRRHLLLFERNRPFTEDMALPRVSAEASERTLADVERAHVARVLERCRGNKSRAAQELGIHRTTLSKKIEEYSLGNGDGD
jgi:Nif-specific regulatory protein